MCKAKGMRFNIVFSVQFLFTLLYKYFFVFARFLPALLKSKFSYLEKKLLKIIREDEEPFKCNMKT